MPDDCNYLVECVFRHDALRAERPIIWISRDDLGVSDGEECRPQLPGKYTLIRSENHC